MAVCVKFLLTVASSQATIDNMTPNSLPTATVTMTANALGHRAEFAARTGLPLPIIRLADGREMPVRSARFSPMFTTLIYTAGPSDTYRHEYLLDILA